MFSPFEYYFPPIFSSKKMTEEENKRYQLLIDCLSFPYASDSFETHHSEIDIMIEDKNIGKIIGKGGNIISQIRKESSASIKIFDELFGSKRKIKICGMEKNIQIAKEKIIKCIK
mgnify:CR=1 FL=1